MKRVTFVLIGILIIATATLLSQKHFEEIPEVVVKADIEKHKIKKLYD